MLITAIYKISNASICYHGRQQGGAERALPPEN